MGADQGDLLRPAFETGPADLEEDAAHWIAVYTELRRVIDDAEAIIEQGTVGELQEANVRRMSNQRRDFDARLAFWRSRLGKKGGEQEADVLTGI